MSIDILPSRWARYALPILPSYGFSALNNQRAGIDTTMSKRTLDVRPAIIGLLILLGCSPMTATDALATPTAQVLDSPARALAGRLETLLQRTRNNSDPRLYAQIEPLLQALERNAPSSAKPKILRAWYDMSLHRFKPALAGLREVHQLGAADAISFGLMSDALVETGEYDEAVRITQQMLDRFPGLAAMSRAAHLRFLHDELDGAIELSRAALDDARADAAAKAWVRLQLAELLLQAGRPEEAERLTALAKPAVSLPASVMLARIRVQQGRTAEALRLYQDALRQQPNPEYAFAIYELARETGNAPLAKRQRQVLEGMARLDTGGLYRRLFAAFLAELPDRSVQAVELAQRELAERPDIYSHMGLAWALYRNGEIKAASEHCRAALRLNTPDPVLRYQAAVILHEAGDVDQGATLRQQALSVQPRLAGYERRNAFPIPVSSQVKHHARD